ncbi:Phosphate carrier protein, mitochondrial, partial [Eumeta japonica]
GLCKFGFYEIFKVIYSGMLDEGGCIHPLHCGVPRRLRLGRVHRRHRALAHGGRQGPHPNDARSRTRLRGVAQDGPERGLWYLIKGWCRCGPADPHTMMKFACFERTLELLYKYVCPSRADCTKGEQLVVTFAAGYIAGVFCAIVPPRRHRQIGHRRLHSQQAGLGGKGLGPRIVMIGTLTALQWFIYDAVKVWLRMPRPRLPRCPSRCACASRRKPPRASEVTKDNAV